MTRYLLPLAALLLSAAPVAAQSEAPPPHLSVVDGRAEIVRGMVREPAQPNTPLVLGDQLRTQDGRAEVLLGDGSALHLDTQTTVDFNGDTVVRLTEGRAILLAERGGDDGLQIDTPPASVRVQSAGEIHLALYDDRGETALQVAVVRGWVDVDAGDGPVPVRAGQQVAVRIGEQVSYPAAFNSAQYDAFTRWSMALVDGRRGTTSAQYLPEDVRVYGSTFDQYGSWSYAQPYGYVWYPRVAVGWRPYHHGRWRHSGRFGWTFVGYNPWGWATHHYGRWGLSAAGSWFWIPKAGWGAAWVHWAVAPGYVGWCPLGWNNRPVLAFWGHRPYPRYRHFDSWRAWSVVPVRAFRGSVPVHRQRFDPAPFRGSRAPRFVVQATPPNVAVPRGSVVAPADRVAGSVAPRGGQSRRGAPLDRTGGSFAAPRSSPGTAAASRGDSAAPPVIYHRGTPRRPGSSGADAYERAGVAVPRGLPASPDRPDSPDATAPRRPAVTASPSSEAPRSRYRAAPSGDPGGRARSTPPAPRSRTAPPLSGSGSGDRPGYAVPRGGQRSEAPSRTPGYRALESPRYRQPMPAPDRAVRQPEYRAPSTPRYRHDGGASRAPASGAQAAPRHRGGDGGGRAVLHAPPARRAPSPRASAPSPRANAPSPRASAPSPQAAAPRAPSSRASAPAGGGRSSGSASGPRSSGGRPSHGTATPRRR